MNSTDWAVIRLSPAGVLDSTFHTDGKQSVDVGATDVLNSLRYTSDGKIVGCGGGNNTAASMRMSSNGVLDSSFHTDGVEASLSLSCSSIHIQTDGNLAMIADTSVDFLFFRALTNGTLDTSFSTDGSVVHNPSSFDDAHAGAYLESKGTVTGLSCSPAGASIPPRTAPRFTLPCATAKNAR